MIVVSVQEAKARLSRLLAHVEDGEDMVILRRGKPGARLTALAARSQSPFGAMRGEFELPEAWNRPLSAGGSRCLLEREMVTLGRQIAP